MDNNNVQNTPATANAENQGRWVPVDQSNLGFDLPQIPNGQHVQGPDGAIYCMGNSQSQLSPVMGNVNNAVPTPPSIVQLPPIVQPIALVPYTAQNQPLLQYDPYSRPIDPTPVAEKTPVYVRKPYKGLSVAAAIVAILGALFMLLLTIVKFNKTEFRPESFQASGISFIAAIISILKGDGQGYYEILSGIAEGATMAKIMGYAMPFIVLVVIIGFICIAIKYFVRFAKGKTPRCVSVAALINFILLTLFAVCALVFSNSEVADEAVKANTSGFFFIGDPATATLGLGWLVCWIFSLVLFIMPFFAKKNTYIVAESNSGETFRMD